MNLSPNQKKVLDELDETRKRSLNKLGIHIEDGLVITDSNTVKLKDIQRVEFTTKRYWIPWFNFYVLTLSVYGSVGKVDLAKYRQTSVVFLGFILDAIRGNSLSDRESAFRVVKGLFSELIAAGEN